MPRKKKISEVIDKFINIHGAKYDYSKVKYINNRTKVCIICPIHGEFYQTPLNHSQGHGCPNCADSGIKLTEERFIKLAKDIHGNKYDYSNVSYVNAHTKIHIVCPKHGKFLQRPNDHLNGCGCPICANEIKGKYQISNRGKFINDAKKIHGNKYNYSKIKYINNRTKVCIICKEHGEFWQMPHNHLQGDGCPKCKYSKLEKEIENLLSINGIKYISQYKSEWLGKQSLDFYIPIYNAAIECQGIQHLKPIQHFGGDDAYKKQKIRDSSKQKKCEKQGVKLIYFSKLKGENIINDEKKLLEELKG